MNITRRGFVKGAALAPLALSPLTGVAQEAAKTEAPKSERFDIVVAGAGHNSLICAAYLARPDTRSWCSKDVPPLGAAPKPRRYACPGSKRIFVPACMRASP